MTEYRVDKIIYESHNFLLRTRRDGKYVIFNKHSEEFYILDDEMSATIKLIMLAEDFVPCKKCPMCTTEIAEVKIEVGKYYKTERGCKARVGFKSFSRQNYGYPFVGEIFEDGIWRLFCRVQSQWSEGGQYSDDTYSPGRNIISEWTEEDEEKWIKDNMEKGYEITTGWINQRND
jgi:hypothetical protein